MSKLNDYNKENLRREDFHVIKNSKYSSIYFKSKNVFIPIELDKLDLLEEELLDKKERVLSEDLCKIINQEPKLNFLSAKDFIFKNKIDVLEIIIQTDCNLNCKYCYAHGGHYGYGRKHLTPKSAKYYLNKLFEYPIREVEKVRFFGGEPSAFPETILTICNYFKHI